VKQKKKKERRKEGIILYKLRHTVHIIDFAAKKRKRKSRENILDRTAYYRLTIVLIGETT
jgi:hypothetical protein